MDGQNQQLLLQGMVKFLCLYPGGFRGNQDFTLLFFQAETEHVSRPVIAKELLVVAGNPSVAYQYDAQFCEGETGDLKRLVYLLVEIFYVYFYFVLQVA